MYSRLRIKESRLSITITFVSIVISGLSLNLIPYITVFEEGKNNIAAYVVAAIFWIGMLAAFVSSYLTGVILYEYREAIVVKGLMKKYHPIGVFSFSKDKRMLILYSITLVGMILIIADIIFGFVSEYIMFPILSITVLSFAVHCVVDGKYYKAYKMIKEIINNETTSKN